MAIFTRNRDEVEQMRTAPWPGGNGHGPAHGVTGARQALRARWWWVLVVAAAVAASVVGVEISSGPATYAVSAEFAQAPGLFPGAAVEVLGVQVGTVTSVRNVGDEVQVGLAVDRGHRIPARASAALVTPEILGEPSIDLSPGYTRGPSLRAGAVIPPSRTAVPVSTERVLQQLRTTLEDINPHAVRALVTNLADDLQGQGKSLNTLIAGAAGTLKLLATKADDLGQLNGALAQLTGQLDSRTSEITQLITDYDTVSGVVAQHSSQLGGAIVQLSDASADLVQLLVPNLAPIESDVGQVTTVGRTIDRNLTSIDEIFAASTALFTGARRVYTSTYNWLTLNAQAPPGLTGAILTGMVRSRLAGVCRRILANHSAGLSTTEKKTLATCRNPSSTFFDPVLSHVPTVLNDVREGKLPASESPAQMFAKGLATIPGVSTAASSPSSPQTSTPSKGAGTAGSAGPAGTTGAPSGSGSTSPGSGSKAQTCLGGLIGIVHCSSGSSKGTTSTSGAGSSTSLLSYRAPAAGGSHGTSLEAAGTAALPALPASAPGASRTTAKTEHHHRDASRHHVQGTRSAHVTRRAHHAGAAARRRSGQ